MTTNVERIEARIAETQERIEQIDIDREQWKRDYGEALARPRVDAISVSTIWDQRAELLAEREQLSLEIEGLRTQQADAPRKDAEPELAKIGGEYEPLAEQARQAVKRFENAVVELERAIPEAFEPAAKATTLRGQAQYLAREHGLEMPQLVDVPRPSAELLERCRAISMVIDEREGDLVRRQRNARRAIVRLEAEEHRQAKQERRRKEREEARRRGNTLWSETVPVVHQ